MAEIFGIAAGMVGFLSLGLQLTESVDKLREIRHTYKDAQADIAALISTLEWLALVIGQSPTGTKPATTDAIQEKLLDDCKKSCQEIRNGIVDVLGSIQQEIAETPTTRVGGFKHMFRTTPRVAKFKLVFQKKTIDGWLEKLEKSKQNLVFALTVFGRNDTAARFDHMSTSMKRMEQLLEDGAGTLPPALQRRRRLLAATPISTAFSPEDDGVWIFADLDGDGSPDLVYIKTSNTGTGKIEVHGASNESLFNERTASSSTAFPVGDQGTWLMQDWTGDGKADLIYIKTRNTGTKMTEIHVCTAASGYKRFALQTGTCFECEQDELEDDGVWTVSRKGDLVWIKTRNCGSGKIEYHVASRASNYQQFTRHSPTDFEVEDDGTWCIAPARSGDFEDLYYIQTRNTGSGKVEVHAVSASSRWKSRLVDVVTSFEPDHNGRWLMAEFSHGGGPDLVYIKTGGCASGKVEVHVVGQRRSLV